MPDPVVSVLYMFNGLLDKILLIAWLVLFVFLAKRFQRRFLWLFVWSQVLIIVEDLIEGFGLQMFGDGARQRAVLHASIVILYGLSTVLEFLGVILAIFALKRVSECTSQKQEAINPHE